VQVKRRQRNKEMGSMTSMAAVTASGAQLALGRLVGSLAVVTARDEEFSTGMLASWVSQVRVGWAAVHGLNGERVLAGYSICGRCPRHKQTTQHASRCHASSPRAGLV
jgi:hypothetical protein